MIFQPEMFDYNAAADTFTAELAELQHKAGIRGIGRASTIKGNDDGTSLLGQDRHFRLDQTDKSGGDIAGWWYEEISGKGKVLIINGDNNARTV